MTHRADLVHRMAQHLLVQMKENARPKKEEPVTFTSLKAKPKLTKSEQDTLDMMTEIARSRNFSKQGGKSKYQKRNKKTQPPKLCSSCKIKETPEWRKGPEGPRTLCNACGLHWAKLMRNRNASGAKWIGDGPQPPIDIITLRQVTGVGPQLQASESGEFEMPGIYTNIPANRLLGEQHLPRPRVGRASLAGSPANEASVSSTSGVTPQTQKNEIEVGLSQATEATTMASASQPPPPPPSTVESMEESMTNEEPPSSPIEQASGKKRKAESDLDDEDMTDPDGAHSAKRQRR
ncbi:hypothetical protein FRB91_008768 [Serendipita sp. 411]|nr:hypothetical protein FRB91_008768 [Serendipita sp. 411]